MGSPPDSGMVDETGHFQIRAVTGRVLFRVGAAQGPPVQGWYLKSVVLNGVDIIDSGFDAKPSTNTTGLEVTMTDKQTSLSGSVRNARGDAMKDFVVAIFPAAAKEGTAATRFTRARPSRSAGPIRNQGSAAW